MMSKEGKKYYYSSDSSDYDYRDFRQRRKTKEDIDDDDDDLRGDATDHIADLLSQKKRRERLREKHRRGSFYLSTWLFLKLLSIVFFVAFFSSYIQVKGLIGDDGILPVSHILERQLQNQIHYHNHNNQNINVNQNNNNFNQQQQQSSTTGSPSSTNIGSTFNSQNSGNLPITQPSISNSGGIASLNVKEINSIWILFTHPTHGFGFSVNNTLYILCCLGLIFSALSIFTTSTATYIGFMWFCYYCIVDVGQIFYSYQWDQLLLETSFLAIFISPFNLKYDDKPSAPIRYLLKWLAFRVLFGSGIVKLTPIWASLQSMSFYYETQCIPNLFSYYFHQFPNSFHQFSTLMGLIVEILIPPFFFAPRFFKITACCISMTIQCFIILTGNHNFFNYLCLALLVLLLDDSFILGVCSIVLPSPFHQYMRMLEYAMSSRVRQGRELLRRTDMQFTLSNITSKSLLVPFVFILVGMSTLYSSTRYLQRQSVPTIVQRVHSALTHYHLTGTYGMYSQVAVERYEITIEGSYDGMEWFEYEFYYKPGNLARSPPLVFPGHQPRLDWQMWFASISDSRTQSWIVHFMAKLLEGSAEVQSLIEYSPFPLDRPPKYIRAHKYHYSFTNNKSSSSSSSNNNNNDNNNNNNNNSTINSSNWWNRHYLDVYIRPFSLDSPTYKYFLLDYQKY